MYETELEFLKNTVVDVFSSVDTDDFSVDDKGICDVVTDVDKALENEITKRIKNSFPDDKIHGEEFSFDQCISGRTWTIDPIDGTYNFSVGSHDFGVQCALIDSGEVVVSVIYLPKFKELYWANKNGGAYMNGKKLMVSKRPPEKAIVSIGDFPHSRKDDALAQIKVLDRCYSRVARLRMFGAASIDYALLASGRTDGLFLYTRHIWDLAPGICLCREAGAYIFGVDGKKYDFTNQGLCIVNTPELFNAIFD